MFSAESEIKRIVSFIKQIFAERPGFKGAVLGISGGKDSFVCAALCARALGSDRVLGVLIPNGEQHDIKDSRDSVKYLGIQSLVVNIGKAFQEMVSAIGGGLQPITMQNIAPRLRMTTLYALAQERQYLVCTTANLSEITIGYTTKWGDAAGDFAPIAHLTKSEVVEVGVALGLPFDLVHKIPADGISGKTDEESFGFTYTELDSYIRNGGSLISSGAISKIERRIAANKHKQLSIPMVQ